MTELIQPPWRIHKELCKTLGKAAVLRQLLRASRRFYGGHENAVSASDDAHSGAEDVTREGVAHV